METTENEDFNGIFNLSPYMFIHPGEAGGEAFDLLKFLYDLRDLPYYQAKQYSGQIKSYEESEHLGDMIYTTKSIADNFLMVAPILLYRLTETYLKKYLLILYNANLTNTTTIRGQTIIIREAIMTGNITTIKRLYLNSSARLDINTLPSFDIIEELRELNNSLKHNHDFVSEELHKKNNFWTTDELITVDKIKERVAYFDHGINSFFYNLVDKVKPYFP